MSTDTKPCPICGAASKLVEVGTASGRASYDCPTHKVWKEKNAAAVALGSLGGKARANGLSAERRAEIATEANRQRWLREKSRR